MKGGSYAEIIRRLARQVHVDGPAQLPADERRLVSAVEQALRARARRRVLGRRVSAFGLAAAAALALVAGLARWRAAGTPAVAEAARAARALTVLAAADAPSGALVEGRRPFALEPGMPVGAGLTLRAPAGGEVRVGTTDGTSLALEAGGELTVAETGATQRFALKSGAVSARVSRLFAGERFIVDTSDAEVEVHGTAFRVAIVPSVASCGGGSTTRVSVSEGVVRVLSGRREVSVAAGGVWPEGCDALSTTVERTAERPRAPRLAHAHAARAEDEAAAPSPAPAEAGAATVAGTATAPAPAATPAAPPPLAPASSLGAENDLFAAAVRARKQGHADEATRLFAELATSYPGSPLVESALVQRMKLLATVDPAAGARAAAAYLERFPNGFARPEAEALAGRRAP